MATARTRAGLFFYTQKTKPLNLSAIRGKTKVTSEAYKSYDDDGN